MITLLCFDYDLDFYDLLNEYAIKHKKDDEWVKSITNKELSPELCLNVYLQQDIDRKVELFDGSDYDLAIKFAKDEKGIDLSVIPSGWIDFDAIIEDVILSWCTGQIDYKIRLNGKTYTVLSY